MKKALFFILTLGIVFFLGSCNDPDGENYVPPGGELPVVFNPDGKYALELNNDVYAATIDISSMNLREVSNYQNVTLTAVLYSDAEGTTEVTQASYNSVPASDAGGIAYFKLLKTNSNWDSSSNHCGPTKYSMVINGNNILNFSAEDTGAPRYVLLETLFPDIVKCIGVSTIVFAPRVSNVQLDSVFGSSVSVSGNRITFTNASYGSSANGNNWDGTAGVGGAALYIFDSSFFPLADKTTLTFNFKLEGYHTSGTYSGEIVPVEQQIHVQAAQNTPEKNMFNGQNPSSGNGNVGQEYITLSDNMDANGVGSFTVLVSKLLAAAGRTIDGDDGKGPFTLNAVRITNNGTMWTDAGVTRYRDKNYTLIIESVTCE
jgi:hypothetical protein